MNSPALEPVPSVKGKNPEYPGSGTRRDFGAGAMIDHAVQTVVEAKRISDLRRAEKIMSNAGVLAAREAVFYGIEIQGWQGDLDRLPRATSDKVVEDEAGGAYVNYELSQLESLPERYQILANLAENYELRRIRRTGSPLDTLERERRFARERLEEARKALNKAEAELSLLMNHPD